MGGSTVYEAFLPVLEKKKAWVDQSSAMILKFYFFSFGTVLPNWSQANCGKLKKRHNGYKHFYCQIKF
jgi:hypothetical protein